MKRTLIIAVFFIIFLLIYFLQTNFFSWYNIAGIKPNLFIIFALFIGLYLGKKYGATLGIIFGILLDFFIGKRIGLNAIMLGIAGLIGVIIDKSISKESRITFMLMVFIVTILCEIVAYTLQIILLSADTNIEKFMQIVAIEATYNAILSIILYPLIQKIGNNLEDIFSNRKESFMRYY